MAKRTPITQISASDLASLQPAARHMQIRQRRVAASHSGGHHSRLRGRGMEFDDVRVYQPGDDVRHIDWGITARTGTAHTKLYREERERPVIVACDFGRSLQFATRGAFKSVRACQLAALMIWAAHLNGDRVGALLYDGTRHRALKPQRGQNGVLHLFKQISEFQEQSYKLLDNDAVPENTPPMERLRRLAPTGSLVCVVSDFQRFDEAERRSLQSLTRHSELILVQVSDPIEAELPERGELPLQTPGGRTTIHCSPERSRQQREAFEQRQQNLRDWARQHRAHWVHCRTDDDPARCLARQLEVRRL